MSRILLLSIVCILAVHIVYAEVERPTLSIGQSFLFDGKNVTLVDSSEDSVIICVNGEKTIISNQKTVNGVIIDLVDSDESQAKLRLDYECNKDCECNEDECSNNICFRFMQAATTSIENTVETTKDEDGKSSSIETTTIDQKAKEGTNESIKTFTYVLIGLAVAIGVVAFSRQRKEEEIDI